MNKPNNLTELFEKLNDLKSIFHYGQKLIPIIQSLIDFMGETVPLLDNINNSITESTSKIPKATNQISNVTSATELATTEILDTVDAISNELNNIENLLKIEFEKDVKRNEVISELLKFIPKNEETEKLFEELMNFNNSKASITEFYDKFDNIKTGTYNITLSLQVQDITAQQLAAVNHLIEGVQSRLSSLLVNFNDANIKELEFTADINAHIDEPADAAFNSEARYENMEIKQKMIDEMVSQGGNSKASQAEIDKLFS